jgi:DNA-binding CsgD family transcriptional regulator
MTTISCPRCGYIFKPSEVYIMTEAERLVLETLRDLRQSPFSPVPAKLIADFIGYSPRWVRQHLTNMRRHDVVALPRGRCSGWIEVYALEMSEHLIGHVQHNNQAMVAA